VEKVFEKPKPRPKNMLVAFAINKPSEEAFNERARKKDGTIDVNWMLSPNFIFYFVKERRR